MAVSRVLLPAALTTPDLPQRLTLTRFTLDAGLA